MTELTPTSPPAGSDTPAPGENTETPPPAVTAEDVARLQAALDKERDLHKTVKQQLNELKNQSRESMDATERALLEARESAAAEVRAQYGSRLAETEFRAAAAARNAGYDVAKALRYVNLAGFVGEDGEPDTKAIAAAVADLVPEVATGPVQVSFDGGPRQSSQPTPDMSQLIRQAAGRA